MELGSSYLPSDIVAAFLYAQLENMELINKRRLKIFDFYYKALRPFENDGYVRMPCVSNSVVVTATYFTSCSGMWEN